MSGGLFPLPDRHDAGSKLRMGLLPGVRGDALFLGDRHEHRIWLSRWLDTADISSAQQVPYALWIGHNPSSAGPLEDDLTVRKEWSFTQQRSPGLAYIKTNIMSYCATDPASMGGMSLDALVHPANLKAIVTLAQKAAYVVLATGSPITVGEAAFSIVHRELEQRGIKMLCLGRTKDGWPRHPSRLAYSTPFEVFRA